MGAGEGNNEEKFGLSGGGGVRRRGVRRKRVQRRGSSGGGVQRKGSQRKVVWGTGVWGTNELTKPPHTDLKEMA